MAGPAKSPEHLLRFDGVTCRVLVGAGASRHLDRVWRAEWTEAAVIGDSQVVGLHGAAVVEKLQSLARQVMVLDFPPGETHKTRQTKARLEDALLAAGFSRQTCVVALGGGISLDLAGFVAATYLRGVPYLSLPTSLLAQVDACIGGKTGVNTAHGKNLVGAIHQPAAVLVDPLFLDTLPAEQWPAGLAELVKHAVIADEDLLAWIEQRTALLAAPPWRGGDHPLQRSVEIKGTIVQQDEHEQDLRSVLNFGHTVGHALEKASGHHLDHGRAVALGMLVEGRVARELCGFPPGDLLRLGDCLDALGLPVRPPAASFEELVPFLAVDKKRADGQLRLALPARIGRMATQAGRHTCVVTTEQLRAAWEESLEERR
jgi:3-dehydroquinate synthase